MLALYVFSDSSNALRKVFYCLYYSSSKLKLFIFESSSCDVLFGLNSFGRVVGVES